MSSDTTGPAPLGTSTTAGNPTRAGNPAEAGDPTRAGDLAEAGASWCDRCGTPADEGDHTACRAARQLEPPRYCGHCRRRMKVQVLPVGWAAVCVEHGETRA